MKGIGCWVQDVDVEGGYRGSRQTMVQTVDVEDWVQGIGCWGHSLRESM